VAEILPAQAPAGRLVRVNAAGSGQLAADLELVASLPLDGLVVPKATVASVAALEPVGPPIVAVVETARGLNEASEIASVPRVEALLLGAFDLAAELALEPLPDALELLYARSKLVVDSAAAGIRKPFDRVFPTYSDADGLRREARLARALGFGGKACIDPRQPEVVNEAFGATAAAAGAT
jgi:citrate lyase beta subunit